ncbi:MAG: adenine phosphoribosyltransferase [Bryobacterales bacterium]|nr:adenine phosphoribosyltransferase [Bryobacterales bacterium]
MEKLRALIREVPDFPKPGILFYDITTAVKDPQGLALMADALEEAAADTRADLITGMESRGFLFGPLLATRLGSGFVLMRKPGKLPSATESVGYGLEYGTDSLEVHVDAIQPGQRVLIVDDLLATGGTAAAAVELVEKLGGEVAGLLFVIELDFLNGRKKLAGYPVRSLLHYDS